MTDLERQIAELIWTTSRADEGTISATGANIIAAALLPLIREREAAAWERGRGQGRRDARGVEEHRHQRQIGLVCHSHGGVTHWHDNDGPAYTLAAVNPYAGSEEGR